MSIKKRFILMTIATLTLSSLYAQGYGRADQQPQKPRFDRQDLRKGGDLYTPQTPGYYQRGAQQIEPGYSKEGYTSLGANFDDRTIELIGEIHANALVALKDKASRNVYDNLRILGDYLVQANNFNPNEINSAIQETEKNLRNAGLVNRNGNLVLTMNVVRNVLTIQEQKGTLSLNFSNYLENIFNLSMSRKVDMEGMVDMLGNAPTETTGDEIMRKLLYNITSQSYEKVEDGILPNPDTQRASWPWQVADATGGVIGAAGSPIGSLLGAGGCSLAAYLFW